jgi:riboflavin synthase
VFTGIVSAVGTIVRVGDTPAGRECTIASPWTDLADGESVNVDGVCLTVTRHEGALFAATAVQATKDRTTVGRWRQGTRVNLERAMQAHDRLGGHIVQGHVDGVATVTAVSARSSGARAIEIEVWDGADGLYIPQGSIAIDGVSLTVAALGSSRRLTVEIIAYTASHTTLGERATGDAVNVEFDVVGKYVRQMLAPWEARSG